MTKTPDNPKLHIKHTVLEDIYALSIGCSFIVLGLVFLRAAGLVTGGVAGIDITSGLPRVEEIFEARVPKGQALISEMDGTAEILRDQLLAM